MAGALVLVDVSSKVAEIVDLFDGNNGSEPASTPHESANKKKQKGSDGLALDSTVSTVNAPGSVIPREEEVREK